MRTAYTTQNPFAAFRDLDRVLNGVWSKVEEGVNQAAKQAGSGCCTPDGSARFAIDVIEADDRLVVTADLPGFTKDQVSVSVEDHLLTIEAARDAADHAESTVHVHERRLTDARRRFKVPSAYDTTQVDARLEHGVLTLTLPKREEKKPHAIEVK